MPRGARERELTRRRALDDRETLFELGTRDLWQAQVLSRDAESIGRVIRQVIEPELYTVRYLVVYAKAAGRHFLVPSTLIVDIDEFGVHCDLTAEQAAALPPFDQHLERTEESDIYEALGRTPHWVEEAAALRFTQRPEPVDPH